MSAIVSTHTARRDRRCTDNACPWCPRWIKAGEAYTRYAMPPGWDLNSSGHWWVIDSCPDCVYWRGHGSDVITWDRVPGEVMP